MDLRLLLQERGVSVTSIRTKTMSVSGVTAHPIFKNKEPFTDPQDTVNSCDGTSKDISDMMSKLNANDNTLTEGAINTIPEVTIHQESTVPEKSTPLVSTDMEVEPNTPQLDQSSDNCFAENNPLVLPPTPKDCPEDCQTLCQNSDYSPELPQATNSDHISTPASIAEHTPPLNEASPDDFHPSLDSFAPSNHSVTCNDVPGPVPSLTSDISDPKESVTFSPPPCEVESSNCLSLSTLSQLSPSNASSHCLSDDVGSSYSLPFTASPQGDISHSPSFTHAKVISSDSRPFSTSPPVDSSKSLSFSTSDNVTSSNSPPFTASTQEDLSHSVSFHESHAEVVSSDNNASSNSLPFNASTNVSPSVSLPISASSNEVTLLNSLPTSVSTYKVNPPNFHPISAAPSAELNYAVSTSVTPSEVNFPSLTTPTMNVCCLTPSELNSTPTTLSDVNRTVITPSEMNSSNSLFPCVLSPECLPSEKADNVPFTADSYEVNPTASDHSVSFNMQQTCTTCFPESPHKDFAGNSDIKDHSSCPLPSFSSLRGGYSWYPTRMNPGNFIVHSDNTISTNFGHTVTQFRYQTPPNHRTFITPYQAPQNPGTSITYDQCHTQNSETLITNFRCQTLPNPGAVITQYQAPQNPGTSVTQGQYHTRNSETLITDSRYQTPPNPGALITQGQRDTLNPVTFVTESGSFITQAQCHTQNPGTWTTESRYQVSQNPGGMITQAVYRTQNLETLITESHYQTPQYSGTFTQPQFPAPQNSKSELMVYRYQTPPIPGNLVVQSQNQTPPNSEIYVTQQQYQNSKNSGAYMKQSSYQISGNETSMTQPPYQATDNEPITSYFRNQPAQNSGPVVMQHQYANSTNSRTLMIQPQDSTTKAPLPFVTSSQFLTNTNSVTSVNQVQYQNRTNYTNVVGSCNSSTLHQGCVTPDTPQNTQNTEQNVAGGLRPQIPMTTAQPYKGEDFIYPNSDVIPNEMNVREEAQLLGGNSAKVFIRGIDVGPYKVNAQNQLWLKVNVDGKMVIPSESDVPNGSTSDVACAMLNQHLMMSAGSESAGSATSNTTIKGIANIPTSTDTSANVADNGVFSTTANGVGATNGGGVHSVMDACDDDLSGKRKAFYKHEMSADYNKRKSAKH